MSEKRSADIACANCASFRSSLWESLGSAELARMESHKSCQVFRKGNVFIHEGSRPQGVYCIHAGKVKIYRHGDGRDQIIKVAGPGEILGYKALLAEDVYPVSAEALEDVHVCFVPKSCFLESLLLSSSFSQKILRMACKELEVMTENITHMAQKSVRERTAATLLLLHQTYGTGSAGDDPVYINMRREDIASIVGTATETLIRLLADFKQENLIETEGRRVIVRNVQQLKKVAGL